MIGCRETGINMQTLQINVYDKQWNYIGCFWSGNSLEAHGFKELGDYKVERYDGPLLSKEGHEFTAIDPIDCYLKLVEIKNHPATL